MYVYIFEYTYVFDNARRLRFHNEGHSCTSDMCYVVSGVMEFLGNIQGDIKNCEVCLPLRYVSIVFFTQRPHAFPGQASCFRAFARTPSLSELAF